jgi:hypothetical protein
MKKYVYVVISGLPYDNGWVVGVYGNKIDAVCDIIAKGYHYNRKNNEYIKKGSDFWYCIKKIETNTLKD